MAHVREKFALGAIARVRGLSSLLQKSSLLLHLLDGAPGELQGPRLVGPRTLGNARRQRKIDAATEQGGQLYDLEVP